MIVSKRDTCDDRELVRSHVQSQKVGLLLSQRNFPHAGPRNEATSPS